MKNQVFIILWCSILMAVVSCKPTKETSDNMSYTLHFNVEDNEIYHGFVYADTRDYAPLGVIRVKNIYGQGFACLYNLSEGEDLFRKDNVEFNVDWINGVPIAKNIKKIPSPIKGGDGNIEYLMYGNFNF